MAGFDAHKNLAISSVLTAPTPASSGPTLVVKAGEGARFGAPPFNATVWPSSAVPTPLNAEVVRVTAVSTDTLTLARAQEGSSARLIGVGDLIAATITAKTLTDLETRAALKDEQNTFTEINTIQKIYPQLVWHDTAQPVDARVFDITGIVGQFRVRALNDAGTVLMSEPLIVNRVGDVFVARDVYEKGRNTAMGHPVAVPYSAANFTTYPAGTWTVPAPNVRLNAYTLIGKTAIYTLIIDDSSITSGVLQLGINNPIPGAPTVALGVGSARIAAEIAVGYATAGDGQIHIHRQNQAAFTAGATGSVFLSLVLHLP